MSLIVLIGVTGCGKTTVGRELSRRYELPLYEVQLRPHVVLHLACSTRLALHFGRVQIALTASQLFPGAMHDVLH